MLYYEMKNTVVNTNFCRLGNALILLTRKDAMVYNPGRQGVMPRHCSMQLQIL